MASASEVLQELTKIARANMADFIRAFFGSGDPVAAIERLTPAQTAALGEVTVEDFLGRVSKVEPNLRGIRLMHALKLLAGIALAALLAAAPAHGLEMAKETQQIVSDDLQQRGTALRAELEQTYQKLLASRRLSGAGTDITEAVLPYIQAGTPFSEAETILRSAGFIVGPHPEPAMAQNPNRARNWYAVVARISPFVQGFLMRVDLYVSLLPKSPGDYTTVESVSVTLFVSTP